MVLRSRRDWGRLARLHVLDGRQRRTPQACPPPGRGGAALIDERCRELHAPGRTMLGRPQEAWLTEGLRGAPERWNFIAQQTLMARARSWSMAAGASPLTHGTAIRTPATACSARSPTTGCAAAWCSAATHTPPSYAISNATSMTTRRRSIAAEFCGTSITSRGRAQSATDTIVRDNPHILHGDSAHRGYWLLDVTAEQCTARLRVIDDPTDRQAGIVTAATFVVDAGRPGAQPA